MIPRRDPLGFAEPSLLDNGLWIDIPPTLPEIEAKVRAFTSIYRVKRPCRESCRSERGPHSSYHQLAKEGPSHVSRGDTPGGKHEVECLERPGKIAYVTFDQSQERALTSVSSDHGSLHMLEGPTVGD